MEHLTIKYLPIVVYSVFPISMGIGIGIVSSEWQRSWHLAYMFHHFSRNMFFVRDELLLPGTILIYKVPLVDTPSQFYEILNAMYKISICQAIPGIVYKPFHEIISISVVYSFSSFPSSNHRARRRREMCLGRNRGPGGTDEFLPFLRGLLDITLYRF